MIFRPRVRYAKLFRISICTSVPNFTSLQFSVLPPGGEFYEKLDFFKYNMENIDFFALTMICKVVQNTKVYLCTKFHVLPIFGNAPWWWILWKKWLFKYNMESINFFTLTMICKVVQNIKLYICTKFHLHPIFGIAPWGWIKFKNVLFQVW